MDSPSSAPQNINNPSFDASSSAMMSSPAGPASGPLNTTVYTAVYSGIAVFEAMVRGVAVMRRRNDSWVNATQILKVAGVEKGRRTKVLEKEILTGVHEKVQGGYGKYQGTWIPLARGIHLALQYGVSALVSPVFDLDENSAAVAALPVSGRQASPSKKSAAPSSTSKASSSMQPKASPFTSAMSPSPFTPRYPGAPGAFPPNSVPPGYVVSPQHHPGGLPPHTLPSPLGPAGSIGAVGYSSPFAYSQPAPQIYTAAPPISGSSPLKRSRTGEEEEFIQAQAREHHAVASGLGQPIHYYSQTPHHPGDHVQGMWSNGPTPQGGSYENQHGAMGPPASKRSRTESFQGGNVMLSGGVAPPGSSSSARGGLLPPPSLNAGNGIAANEDDGVDEVTFSSLINEDPTDSQSSTSSANAIPPGVLPPSCKLASKPSNPSTSTGDLNRQRNILLSFFSGPEPTLPALLSDPTTQSELNSNLVIDDQGHTALHWAAALARGNVANFLVSKGADLSRGNFGGETPLMRAVLAVNHYEASQSQSPSTSFESLLTLLAPSLQTIDFFYRSVLHHISLIAGLRGRAASARFYMERLLSHILTQLPKEDYKALLDLRDVHGDTALNLAARVGNRSLVKLLVEAGADKALANKLGLKPVDFGIEVELLKPSAGEEVIASLKSGPTAPVQKSKDVIADMTKMVEDLNSEFSLEIATKEAAISDAQTKVTESTKALASERKQMQHWKNQIGELEATVLRIRNVGQAITAEASFDWTGRSDIDGTPANSGGALFGPSKQDSGAASKSKSNSPSGGQQPGSKEDVWRGFDIVDPMLDDPVEELIALRRIKLWQDQVDALLAKRVTSLEKDGLEMENRFRKVISMSGGVAYEDVDQMLDKLTVALESDGEVPELNRVTGFMAKLKEQQSSS